MIVDPHVSLFMVLFLFTDVDGFGFLSLGDRRVVLNMIEHFLKTIFWVKIIEIMDVLLWFLMIIKRLGLMLSCGLDLSLLMRRMCLVLPILFHLFFLSKMSLLSV